MLADLMHGSMPAIHDVLYIQNAIRDNLDIYHPVGLSKQLLNADDMDVSFLIW
jgi:hypothetical protein